LLRRRPDLLEMCAREGVGIGQLGAGNAEAGAAGEEAPAARKRARGLSLRHKLARARRTPGGGGGPEETEVHGD
jgi:hypothetical protein